MDIVIAGGGSAGWAAAWAFSRAAKVNKVTVVESSKIGIIGVGEASSGMTLDLLTDFHTFSDSRIMNDPNPFDMEDFYRKTHATPKFALVHKNWSKVKNHSYFAPIESSVTNSLSPDLAFIAALAKYGTRGVHMSSEIGMAYSLEKWPINGESSALQFDAREFSKYLKNFLTKDPKVTVIDATIKDVELDERGWVENLILDDGSRLGGDFFVDSTGFKRLIANKLDVGWTSYKDVLPVDRAMPFIVEYKPEEAVKPISYAEGMDAGWMWKTNLNHRIGYGYVYSSEFLSDDKAQEEVEKNLGHKIEPVTHMKFDSGSINEFWKKNCLTVGLSASFIEPLEATSLHATMMQVITFVREYLGPDVEKTVNDGSIYFYNKQTREMYDYYKDFVVLHYQGGRTDTPFWKHITNDRLSTPVVDAYIEKIKARLPGKYMFNDIWNVDALWKWTAAGLGMVSQQQAIDELTFIDLQYTAEQRLFQFQSQITEELNKSDLKFEFTPKGK
jgi:flavin-dependent dehydrogenase